MVKIGVYLRKLSLN